MTLPKEHAARAARVTRSGAWPRDRTKFGRVPYGCRLRPTSSARRATRHATARTAPQGQTPCPCSPAGSAVAGPFTADRPGRRWPRRWRRPAIPRRGRPCGGVPGFFCAAPHAVQKGVAEPVRTYQHQRQTTPSMPCPGGTMPGRQTGQHTGPPGYPSAWPRAQTMHSDRATDLPRMHGSIYCHGRLTLGHCNSRCGTRMPLTPRHQSSTTVPSLCGSSRNTVGKMWRVLSRSSPTMRDQSQTR